MVKIKYLLFIILFSCCFSIFSHAGVHNEEGFTYNVQESTSGEIILDFALEQYSIENVNLRGDAYKNIIMGGNVYTREENAPKLPFKQFTFQLKDNYNVSASIVDAEYIEQQIDNPIEPSRGVLYRNQNIQSIPYYRGQTYSRNEFYPGNVIELLNPFIIRNRRGVTLQVYPFQYNPQTQIVRIYTSIKVRLEQEISSSPTNRMTRRTNFITPEMNNIYNDMFVNYRVFDNEIQEKGDLLVIYTSRDADAIAPYITHKTQMGFTVHTQVVDTGTNAKSIIQTAYDVNPAILYVQLVGDWEDVQSDLTGVSPKDPAMACVSGDDDYPDLIIGRFSAENNDQVTVQVNKTINYEKDYYQSWMTSGLGIASDEGAGIGDDGEADFEHMDIIKENKLMPNQYKAVNEIYKTGLASDVSTYINNGLHLINYCGHGSITSWGTTGFGSTDVNALTNGNKLPIIISVACVNGLFKGGTCFAESWLRKENGGAVATLMSTINQAWTPPMRGQDYMNDLLTGGYDYSVNPGNGTTTDESMTTFGAIAFNGMVLMYAESSLYDDLETIQTWTLFGDCSLKVVKLTPNMAPIINLLMGS